MRAIGALALLSLAGPASSQGYTAPDGVNKCVNSGVTTQCTLLGTLPVNVISSAAIMKCDEGYEIVIASRGYMCAKDLKPTK